MKKRNIKGKVILILCIFAAIIAAFQIYIWTGSDKEIKNSDTIIVLGCKVDRKTPTASLQERTEKAEKLYKSNKAEYIIVSGGKGRGEDITEAECMKNILINDGIDKEKIIIEDKSKNTQENIKFSKEIMEIRNLKNAIVVSNKFHLRRAAMICKKNKVNASYTGIFLKDHIFTEIYGGIREMPALIKDFILQIFK